MNRISKLKPIAKIAYYDNFVCTTSACTNTCCTSWDINIDKKSYYEFKADPSRAEHVKKLKGPGQKRNGTHFGRIKLNQNGNCPFLDEDITCSLHNRFGHTALPKICQSFPRTRFVSDGIETSSLSLDCPEVVKLAMLNEDGGFSREGDALDVSSTPIDGTSLECVRALIDFLNDKESSIEKKLLVIGSVIKNTDISARCNYTKLSALLNQTLPRIDFEHPQDPGILQVECFYPYLESIRLRSNQDKMADFRQNARSYLDQRGMSIASRIKQFVIARELFNKIVAPSQLKYLEKLIINQLFSNHILLSREADKASDLIAEITLRASVARFILILNFGKNDFSMSLDDFATIVSTVYRNVGHNRDQIERWKKYINSRCTDFYAASYLLLA